MFGGLFSRKPEPVPSLLLKVEQEFGDMYSADRLMHDKNLRTLCRAELMSEKRFHNKVLFPHFGIPTPTTIVATDFHDEFYPLFLKGGRIDTLYIDSADELAQYRRKHDFGYHIIQEYIKPATQVASHIRLVVAPIFQERREDSV